MGLTLARELPAFACYFGSYDYLLKLTEFKPTDSNATLKILFAGGMAGVNSWALFRLQIYQIQQHSTIKCQNM